MGLRDINYSPTSAMYNTRLHSSDQVTKTTLEWQWRSGSAWSRRQRMSEVLCF